MADGSLTDAIADELRTWDAPVVERAIYGTGDPAAIAAAIADLVRAATGREIARAEFYKASVGSVAGVTLDDGRRVVVKAHQPHVRRARLEAVHEVMTALAAAGFPCPRPVAGPTAIGHGLATIEELVDGARRDGHDPAVRRELARTLVELTRLAPIHDALGASWYTGLPAATVWPRPHSPLFDFEATRAGAERIDAIAAAARAAPRAGRRVTGHFDWRAEHARFDGDRLVAAYDWDACTSTSSRCASARPRTRSAPTGSATTSRPRPTSTSSTRSSPRSRPRAAPGSTATSAPRSPAR